MKAMRTTAMNHQHPRNHFAQIKTHWCKAISAWPPSSQHVICGPKNQQALEVVVPVLHFRPHHPEPFPDFYHRPTRSQTLRRVAFAGNPASFQPKDRDNGDGEGEEEGEGEGEGESEGDNEDMDEMLHGGKKQSRAQRKVEIEHDVKIMLRKLQRLLAQSVCFGHDEG